MDLLPIGNTVGSPVSRRGHDGAAGAGDIKRAGNIVVQQANRIEAAASIDRVRTKTGLDIVATAAGHDCIVTATQEQVHSRAGARVDAVAKVASADRVDDHALDAGEACV